LGAIKGVGEAAVEAMVLERETHGVFKNLYDFLRRVNLRAVNKKNLECLALAGALDGLAGHNNRAVYFWSEAAGKPTVLDTLVRYGQSVQEGKNQASNNLFGDMGDEISIPEPVIPKVEPWHVLQMLNKEKDVVGIYLTGHPLDDFRSEIRSFRLVPFNELDQFDRFRGKDWRSGGIITAVNHRFTKTGKPFGSFSIEDYTGTREFALFSDKYMKMKHYLEPGTIVTLQWRIGNRFGNADQPEVEIMGMNLMADLKDKYSQVTLKLSEVNINETFIQQLTGLIQQFPGKCQLRIQLQGLNPELNVNLLSSTARVDASNADFQELLGKMIGQEYFLLN
jgi:DNA polymerase-3 subunit alpha